jgi:uncharacterized membrane protein YbhN (UPF0104 family)
VRLLHRLLGWAVFALAAAYFVAFAVRHARRLPPLRLDGPTALTLIATVALSLLVLVVAALIWHLLLRSAGERAGLRAVLAVSLVSQIAKYLPGNLGHYLGRLGLARRHGLAAPRVLLTMAYEVSVVTAAAAAVALAGIAAGGERLAAAVPAPPRPWLLAAAIAAVAALPLATGFFLRRYLRRLWPGEAEARRPGAAAVGAAALLVGATFLLHGVALYALARGLYGRGEASPWLLAGIFAVTWLPGFLTPGVPAGVGVREALLVAALDPLYGPGAALGVALLSRGVNLAAEGLALGVGLALARGLPRAAAPGPPGG